MKGEDPLPQPEFFNLVIGGLLGRIRAGLPLHGFHVVMQYGRLALSHPQNIECCVSLTSTKPVPSGFFNLRPRHSPTMCGWMGPATQAARGGSDP